MSARWLHALRTAVRAGPGVGSTLVVGVSGGGDSMALLHALARSRRLKLRLVVAHLDHALRPESGADAAFVGQSALDLRLPCLRERRDVGAIARERGLNVEEAARRERHAFLQEAARAVGADAIALAHSADDQAETVLMHLLRGAGAEGLRAMVPLGPAPLPGATVPLFRPLLGTTRAALRRWLEREGLPWREDATNADTGRTRSRLRHALLPLLEREQPRLRERLAASAARLAEDEALIAPLVEGAWARLATEEAGVLRFAPPLRDEPTAIQRRLIRRAHRALRPDHELGGRALDDALAIVAAEGAGPIALPGDVALVAERGGGWRMATSEVVKSASESGG